MNRLQFLIIIFFIAASIKVSVAQQGLEVDSFTIIKEYVPSISQAAKIKINPTINDTQNLDLNLKYEFLEKEISSQFSPQPITAANLKGEPLVKLYRSYLIAGYGNNATPLIEAYFSQLRSKNISYSFNGRHFSSNGISDIENSGFSENALGLNGNYYTRKLTVAAGIDYQYNRSNYYGFNEFAPTIDIESAKQNQDVEQQYSRFNVNLALGNNQPDTMGLRHLTKIEFNSISDKYGASESRFIIGEDIGLLKRKEIYTFDWAVDYNGFSDSSGRLNSTNTLLKLMPGIELRGSKWILKGGLNLVGDFDTSTSFNVFPVALFRYHLVKSIIIPYVELSGGVNRNNYNRLTKENPFLSSGVPLYNTVEKYRFTGGIGGNLSKSTSFDVAVSQTSTENSALFVKDTISREYRGFTVEYDDVTISEVKAELIFEPVVKWNFILQGSYFIYDTKRELYAWHKPDYRIAMFVKYNLQDKIIVELIATAIGAQKAKLYQIPVGFESLAGTVDLNLSLEYRYTKKISLFLDVNNIASIRYEKWQDYPTQRINMLGGFKFSF